MKKLNVHWDFEGQEHTGNVEFETLDNGKVFVSLTSDLTTQVIENGELNKEDAEDIYNEILSRDCDVTGYEIF
jgi:polyhydroxyalkanoate synthesis regulator phasin